MAENAKRLNPGDHELLANISSREELSYRDLEKALGDQDELAASRDEDPAEDSTDISADMYAYLLNRLKGRTLDGEPFAKVAHLAVLCVQAGLVVPLDVVAGPHREG